MTFLENLLRKLRFDVETIKTNVGIMDKFLGFRPDLVIMTARGKKINGIEWCKKMNPKGDATKIILAISSQAGIKPAELKGINIVGFLESPINPMKAMELIASHLKLDIAVLKENLERSTRAVEETGAGSGGKDSTFVKSKDKGSEDATWVKGKGTKEALFDVGDGDRSSTTTSTASTSPFSSPLETAKGASKYLNHKLLNFEAPKQRGLDKDRIQKAVANIATEGAEPDLDEARRDFVKALYRK